MMLRLSRCCGRFCPRGVLAKTVAAGFCVSSPIDVSDGRSNTAEPTAGRQEGKAPCPFGLLLDIDGVFCRGSHVFPAAREAVRRLTTAEGQFRVPTVFVTNSGNVLRAHKASQLSKRLEVEITAEQLVMSHSPLRMFTEFHQKHVLVCGQGSTNEIARGLGFTHVTTIEQLRSIFSHLDRVEMRSKNNKELLQISETYFEKPIEAIVLLGEPVRWESALQLLIDVLMTDGHPGRPLRNCRSPYPHIPVLACNMDLLWMSESSLLPRFCHGTFLLCLELLYKSLTGHALTYTALLGKPSELTYHHAEFCVRKHAQTLGMPPPTTLYAIGDSPEADVLGANLFDKYLSKRKEQLPDGATSADRCHSILVGTGVYSSECTRPPVNGALSKHLETNGIDGKAASQPTFVVKDILEAVRLIADEQHFASELGFAS